MKSFKKISCCAALLFCSSVSFADKADEWNFEIEPYVFLSSIAGDASVGRISGVPVDLNFGDILETLDATAMLHFEGFDASNGWGVMVDYSFMDLKDDISTPRDGVVSTRTRQGVLELDVFRRYEVAGGLLDYTFGMRWWDFDVEAEVDIAVLPGSVETEIKEDWIDVVVGLRWQKPINKHWTFVARGDIGGFGMEADFTSLLILGAKYNFSETVVIDVNYKATWVDYSDGSKGERGYFAYDTITHGPVIGLIYKF